tara:strand:+ start:1643 stop:1891 length:249 start_codon:yes stop_codon:yes gene_type:complete
MTVKMTGDFGFSLMYPFSNYITASRFGQGKAWIKLAAAEEMLTMEPPPRSIMSGPSSKVSISSDRALIENIKSNSSSVSSSD